MTENHDEIKQLAPLVENSSEKNDFFTINSQKAAEILGVNRTRLSQLTSQGVFPYERRKVNSRSRLFYRLNDILNYQRKSSFGNLPAHAEKEQNRALIPLLPSAATENIPNVNVASVSGKNSQKTILKTHSTNPTKTIPRILQKARDLKILQEERLKNEKLNSMITKIQLQMSELVKTISNMEDKLSKLTKKNLNFQKTLSQSPRIKGFFKRIKR